MTHHEPHQPHHTKKHPVYFDKPPENGYEVVGNSELFTADFVRVIGSSLEIRTHALEKLRHQARYLAAGFHPDVDGFLLGEPTIEHEGVAEHDRTLYEMRGMFRCTLYRRTSLPPEAPR